jgi:lipopolysaccharide transport system permease protein
VTIVQKPLSTLWRKIKLIKRWLPLDDARWAKLNLLKTLVQRDLEARYKGSVLGKLWPLLHQLAQLLIYTYVFGIVLQVKLSLKGLPEDNSFVFGLWLFAGLLPWLAFSEGLQEATTSVIAQPNLVKKVVFPLTLLPLVPILSSFIESTFGLMALITFVVLFTQKLHLTLLLLPLVWLPQLCLAAGLGFFTAGLTVFLRDIPQTLGVVLNLWFYATPLIYPATMIPQPFQTWVFWLNPMAAVGELYRDVILNGTVTHWSEWAVATAVSLLVLLGGYWCYRKLRPAFADVL